jgi:hypothetical protein
MPAKKKDQPAVGTLVQCRLTVGTFSYTSTRRVLRVFSKGTRFVLDGKGNPTVERKNIIAIGRIIPVF